LWEVRVDKDLLDKYYTLKVDGNNAGFNPGKELVDIFEM